MKRAVWGAAALALYLGVALLSFESGLVPVRPLYDGLAPPEPYQWVSPPPEFAETNVPPEGVTSEIEFGPEGSEPRTISTPEGQFQVIFPLGGVEKPPGDATVRVRVEPVATEGLPPPPGDLQLDGNGYRVTVTAGRNRPVKIVRPLTLIMRYPSHATVILRREGSGWEQLDTQATPASLQLFGDTPSDGLFVAGGVPESEGIAWWWIAAGVLIVGALGVELWRYRGRRAAAAGAGGRAARRRTERGNRPKRR